MHSHRRSVLPLAAFSLVALAGLTGCISPRDASTSLKVASPMGKAVEITLPKNLDAEGLEVTVNPVTGEYKLTATKLRSDASGVIDSAGAAQATAIGKLTDTVTALAPLLTPKP